MANRRVRMTINSHYVQPLKLGFGRKIVLAMCNAYNSILITKKYKPKDSTKDIFARVWAKFDGVNFDGIHAVAFLHDKNELIYTSATCLFRVWAISYDGTWTETFLTTKMGALSGNKWTANITQADLGSSTLLDGELTILIEAVITRQGKQYKNRVYVNHLGIYESFFRLKEEVEFLFVTKKDE